MDVDCKLWGLGDRSWTQTSSLISMMDNWTGQLLSCSREVGGQGGDVYARLALSACLRFEATVSLSSLLSESHILQLFVGASCSRAG